MEDNSQSQPSITKRPKTDSRSSRGAKKGVNSMEADLNSRKRHSSGRFATEQNDTGTAYEAYKPLDQPTSPALPAYNVSPSSFSNNNSGSVTPIRKMFETAPAREPTDGLDIEQFAAFQEMQRITEANNRRVDELNSEEDFDELEGIDAYNANSINNVSLTAGTVLALYLKGLGNNPLAIAKTLVSRTNAISELTSVLSRVHAADAGGVKDSDYHSYPAIETSQRAMAMLVPRQVTKDFSLYEALTKLVDVTSWTLNGNILSLNNAEIAIMGSSPFTPQIKNTAPLAAYFTSTINLYTPPPSAYYWACFNGMWTRSGSNTAYDLHALPVAKAAGLQPIVQMRAASRGIALSPEISHARDYLGMVMAKFRGPTDLVLFRKGFINFLSNLSVLKPAFDALYAAIDVWYNDLIKPEFFKTHFTPILKNLEAFVVANKAYRKRISGFCDGSIKVQALPEFDYPYKIINHLSRKYRANYVIKCISNDRDAVWGKEGPYLDITTTGWVSTFPRNTKFVRCYWYDPGVTPDNIYTGKVLKHFVEQYHSKIVILQIGEGATLTMNQVMVIAGHRYFTGECYYMRELLRGTMEYHPKSAGLALTWKANVQKKKKNPVDYSSDFASIASLFDSTNNNNNNNNSSSM